MPSLCPTRTVNSFYIYFRSFNDKTSYGFSRVPLVATPKSFLDSASLFNLLSIVTPRRIVHLIPKMNALILVIAVLLLSLIITDFAAAIQKYPIESYGLRPDYVGRVVSSSTPTSTILLNRASLTFCNYYTIDFRKSQILKCSTF